MSHAWYINDTMWIAAFEQTYSSLPHGKNEEKDLSVTTKAHCIFEHVCPEYWKEWSCFRCVVWTKFWKWSLWFFGNLEKIQVSTRSWRIWSTIIESCRQLQFFSYFRWLSKGSTPWALIFESYLMIFCTYHFRIQHHLHCLCSKSIME